jgi:serine/threonine protein kinase
MCTSDLTLTAGSLDAMAHEPSDKPGPSTEASTAAWQTGLPTNSGATRPADPPTADERTTHAGSLPIPGHEILGELGRGGMGVVYKARQTHLNRVVAVKVVLAGGHASADELARFRAEAEAVARMQHPSIVQIFETGQQDGLPYFTLEYVDGGSLAHKLDGTPLPAAEAAKLVETLARAVHYAHANGVVHRDLKPANVLLAKGGTPKITDFGLAKKVEGGSDMTKSGAIMGTPSYMAPEQAGGSKDIGPATDIYALGAILYECLTGRPPFKAATREATILQVVADQPVPPRQLQSNTPRDLETVCMKCLEKQPSKRYPTANDLADELRRFLEGKPVHARPVGKVGRLVRWARRRPRDAGLAALGSLAALILFVLVFMLLLDRETARAVENSVFYNEASTQSVLVQQRVNHALEACSYFSRSLATNQAVEEQGFHDRANLVFGVV